MIDFTVTQSGKKLNKKLYTWDENTKTFSSIENNLVLDFSDVGNCTFNTGSGCTFKTGSECTFNTGSECTFNTGSECTFNTGSGCTFKTGSECIFKTGSNCIFKAYCSTFKTGDNCTFDTGHNCTFDTGSDCTFNTDYGCAFDTGVDCVVVRRDIFEVIELEKYVKIKLNNCRIKGYTVIEDVKYIEIDGKKIEISLESYEKLKESLV